MEAGAQHQTAFEVRVKQVVKVVGGHVHRLALGRGQVGAHVVHEDVKTVAKHRLGRSHQGVPAGLGGHIARDAGDLGLVDAQFAPAVLNEGVDVGGRASGAEYPCADADKLEGDGLSDALREAGHDDRFSLRGVWAV